MADEEANHIPASASTQGTRAAVSVQEAVVGSAAVSSTRGKLARMCQKADVSFGLVKLFSSALTKA